MSEQLINKGISIVGDASTANHQRIVIVGTARGGTSMVAGALAHLGVFMGDKAHKPVYEDVALSELFETKNYTEAQKMADAYTDQHGRWAWKRPSSINYLQAVHENLQNPIYIFVFKDILSIAQRNSISMLNEILPGLKRAIEQYGQAISFLESHQPRAMLTSYDKVLADPKHFIEQICIYCKLEPSTEEIEKSIAFIQPNPTDYLDASRITKARGRLETANLKKVKGWAFYLHQTAPASVQVFLNDQLVGETKANMPRADLKNKFDRDCHFIFEFPPNLTPSIDDKIRVRVVNEVTDLNGSPATIASL